ncbi:MAG: hypothetical protein KU29_06295 [Sulfurovum sp. FS06-10]|jgi:hypothetical protein|nr:MAG: hypothetical protein KU29_06295 [Sulfurovum sp. FS06-10]
MRINNGMQVQERRKKRVFIPSFYFVAEMVFIWLVLSLIQLEFDVLGWNDWGVVIFSIFFIYSLGKTVHVYKRQNNYH